MEIVQIDMSNLFATGALSEGAVVRDRTLRESVFQKVAAGCGKGMMFWTELDRLCDWDSMCSHAETLRNSFDALVVLGIGGSALGTSALAYAFLPTYHNELPREKRQGPKIYVMDNVEPDQLHDLGETLCWETTAFCVISKSGSTSETAAQFAWVRAELMRRGLAAKKHVYVITEEGSQLQRMAETDGNTCFLMPKGVGGRFSIFTAVGMFPALVLGIDAKQLRNGAKKMQEVCSSAAENPALWAAYAHWAEYQQGKSMAVVMPYANRLKYFSDYFAQLLAESIGKRFDNDGKEVCCGQTPIKSVGVTDQHSQLQLYMEGPADKLVAFLEVGAFDHTLKISDATDAGFLQGHTFNELLQSELNGTRIALTQQNRPNYTIVLPRIDAFCIGQLIYLWQMQTAYLGAFFNVNAFDQPGVEEGKNITYAFMGKSGYEAKKAEAEKFCKTDARFVFPHL